MKKPACRACFADLAATSKKWDLETDGPFRELFLETHDGWGDVETWRAIQTFSPPVTNGYFLNAVDMQKGSDGIEARPDNQKIYIKLFKRTMFMSLVITFSCIMLAYPVAWLLANLPMRTSNLLMILVLLPFWTSLLVRTSAWKVMLQQQGVINDVLVWLGIVGDDARFVMINNQFGTIVAMTHILLPFMILPMYSVMQGIPETYLRAAKSLGATDWTAFWRVYFPQSVPGIGAWLDPRVHPVHWLLHHARNCGRHHRGVHLQPDRVPHLQFIKLGTGGGIGGHIAGGRAGALLGIRSHRWHRQRQVGGSEQWPSHQYPKNQLSFTLPLVALAGAFGGLFVGTSNGSGPIGMLIGAALIAGLAFAFVAFKFPEKPARWGMVIGLAVLFYFLAGLPGAGAGGHIWLVLWLVHLLAGRGAIPSPCAALSDAGPGAVAPYVSRHLWAGLLLPDRADCRGHAA